MTAETLIRVQAQVSAMHLLDPAFARSQGGKEAWLQFCCRKLGAWRGLPLTRRLCLRTSTTLALKWTAAGCREAGPAFSRTASSPMLPSPWICTTSPGEGTHGIAFSKTLLLLSPLIQVKIGQCQNHTHLISLLLLIIHIDIPLSHINRSGYGSCIYAWWWMRTVAAASMICFQH